MPATESTEYSITKYMPKYARYRVREFSTTKYMPKYGRNRVHILIHY
jgi:hypothetical protein